MTFYREYSHAPQRDCVIESAQAAAQLFGAPTGIDQIIEAMAFFNGEGVYLKDMIHVLRVYLPGKHITLYGHFSEEVKQEVYTDSNSKIVIVSSGQHTLKDSPAIIVWGQPSGGAHAEFVESLSVQPKHYFPPLLVVAITDSEPA